MSVGGKVVEALDCGDSVWVNTNDGSVDCAVYVERTPKALAISTGDMLWWQAGVCYWTAKTSKGEVINPAEHELKKISGSGVNRPKQKEIQSWNYQKNRLI